jgi:trigger factor
MPLKVPSRRIQDLRPDLPGRLPRQADLAGQTVQFEITVKQVQAPKLPELDAEFAIGMGIADGDVTKMRAEIEANLKREVKRRIEGKLKDQVMEALIKANPITARAPWSTWKSSA